MKVEEHFNFSDFTTKHYQELLDVTKSKYRFCFFNEIDPKDESDQVIWRHDVDFSVHRALRLAQMEKASGVKSTYFLHLHSEYYNCLEKEIVEIIHAINNLGHQIGIHFDSHFYDIQDETRLDHKIKLETELFKSQLGITPKAFSFHNTTPFTMNCKAYTYGGLINAYADFFQSNFAYCSDSNGYWRYTRMYDFIKENTSSKIQILTHPEWWQEETKSPWERISRAIDGRAARNKAFYKNHLQRFNMKNIDWDGEI